MLEKKSKGDGVRGTQGCCWQSGAHSGRRELSRKRCLLAQGFGAYLRPKQDGSFVRMLGMQDLHVSHNSSSDRRNLAGDA